MFRFSLLYKIGVKASKSSLLAGTNTPAKPNKSSKRGKVFKWRKSPVVAPAPDNALESARGKSWMSSNEAVDDGVEEMETEMSPERNGEWWLWLHVVDKFRFVDRCMYRC